MILSISEEDLQLIVFQNKILVTPSSFKSGLRALLKIDRHHNLLQNSTTLNKILAKQGWTVYAHSGRVRLAVLGLKGRRGLITTFYYFGRLCRLAGAI